MGKHDFYLKLTDKKGRETMFSNITNIVDFIRLKLTALELLMSQWHRSLTLTSDDYPYMYIEDKRIKRAFVVSNNKIVSFGFSLNIITNDNRVSDFIMHTKDKAKQDVITKIKLKHVSEALSILNTIEQHEDLYINISDDDLESQPSKEGKMLFEYLLLEEPAYIRYDNDKKTAQGEKSIIHPRYHFDINFTPSFSYKFGLPKEIDIDEFKDIITSHEFCRILSLKRNRLGRGINSSKEKNLKFQKSLKKHKGYK